MARHIPEMHQDAGSHAEQRDAEQPDAEERRGDTCIRQKHSESCRGDIVKVHFFFIRDKFIRDSAWIFVRN